MTFAPLFLPILCHLYHYTSLFEIFGIFSRYVIKPNKYIFDVCIVMSVGKVAITTIGKLPECRKIYHE